MKNWTRLLTVLILVLAGANSASAQSSPPPNPNYTRFNVKADGDIPTPAANSVYLFFNGTGFRFKDEAAAFTDVGGTPISGTAGVIPAIAAGGTSLEDSKMTTSGTNKGTWTLYDDTGGTGVTSLVLRKGVGQGSVGVLEAYGDGVEVIGRSASNRFSAYMYGLSIGYPAIGAGELRVGTSTGTTAIYTNSVALSSGVHLRWSSGDVTAVATDSGVLRDGDGILRVTDGSTGQGGIGIADSAANTVSDALILKHQGGTVAGNGFGTGLLFQGENDGGVMHNMASIDAVWSLDDDTNEQSQFKFSTYDAGGELPILTLYKSGGETKLDAPYNMDLISGNILALYGATQLTFVTNAANKWIIPSTGEFYPAATNTYDIGTSSAFVRNNYVSTSIQGTRSKVLSEGAPTGFVDISVASGEGTGGYIAYTVETTDGTDRTIETGMLYFSAINLNGGTVDDSDFGLVGTPVQSTSAANTFVNTFSVTSGADKITVNCSSATTLAGTDVITIRYRVVVNRGTATVTPIA